MKKVIAIAAAALMLLTLLAGCPEQPPALIHAQTQENGEIVLVTA